MKRFPLYLFLLIYCWSCSTGEPDNKLFPFEESHTIPSNLTSAERTKLSQAIGRKVPTVSIGHLQNMLERAEKGLHVYSFYTLDCEACLEINMHLNHIETELSDQNLKIFYVNLDNYLENDTVVDYVRSRGITGWVFQLRTTVGWREELGLDWDGTLPAVLLVNQDLDARQLYQQAFSYGELYALMQPYL